VNPRVSRTLPLVQPILLTPRGDAFNDPAWLFEPKYAGYRGLLYVTRQGCHFRSKRGNILKRFEQLCYWVREELPVKEAILDGEVVALDSEGRQKLQGPVSRPRQSSLRRVRRALGQRKGSAWTAFDSTEESSDRTHPSDHNCALAGVFD
jgi:ATP-dependent DNA ligase